MELIVLKSIIKLKRCKRWGLSLICLNRDSQKVIIKFDREFYILLQQSRNYGVAYFLSFVQPPPALIYFSWLIAEVMIWCEKHEIKIC